MSVKANVITLKQLVLGLCGEDKDGNITSDDGFRIIRNLAPDICYGRLKAWKDDQPFFHVLNVIADMDETFTGNVEKYSDYAVKNAGLIIIRKEDFETYIKPNVHKEAFLKERLSANKFRRFTIGGNGFKDREIFPEELRRRYKNFRPFDDKAASQTRIQPEPQGKTKRGPQPSKERKKIIAYMKERTSKRPDVTADEVVKGMDKRKIDHSKMARKTIQNLLGEVKRGQL
jgi:hypothetical protein